MGDESPKSPTEKLRRKTHLPRDWQGLIRLPWLENFYETLYASNERGIYIPYTVVFQYRRIYAAYYTDSDGYVQKVDKIGELNPEQVLEGLKGHGQPSEGGAGCRAYHCYTEKNEADFGLKELNQDLSVEYFDDPSTTHFLTYRGKENNGILQQFLEPSTTCVSSIRAYWTPHYCNLEARINNNKADATHVPMSQRLVTFEGELHHSQPFPMSTRIKLRINKTIGKIVAYVKECLPSHIKIQLMILNLKMGQNGKIWFLYCSSLRLYDSSVDAGGYGRDSDSLRPSSAHLKEASIPPPGVRGSKKRKGLVCPSTDTRLGPFDTYKVTVQQVFTHFLWHGPRQAWALLGRSPPVVPLEGGRDPAGRPDALRWILTMDLRPSPVGKPFFWCADMDDASKKQQDYSKWSNACKEAHRKLEKKFEAICTESDEIRLAYRHWEACMVWLLSQEIESLSQENFKQERVRPHLLNSKLHCGENAMYVYASTYELVLDEERKRLIQPAFLDLALISATKPINPSPVKDPFARDKLGSRSGSKTARTRSDRTTTMGPQSRGALTERSWGSDRRITEPMFVGFGQLNKEGNSILKSSVTRRMMTQALRFRGPGSPQPSGPGRRRDSSNDAGKSGGAPLPTVLITHGLVSQLQAALTGRGRRDVSGTGTDW